MKRKDRIDLNRTLEGAEPRLAPLRIRVLQSNLPRAVKLRMFTDLALLPGSDKYVQWCTKALSLPLGTLHPCRFTSYPVAIALERARVAMDDVIVGQEMAKLEVLKLVHQTKVNPTAPASAYALGFEGKPGCGKTQFVQKAMAAALGLPVVTVPLGGASDGSSFLWGHSYSYEGSKEGRLAGGLMEVGCCNPIIHLDEVDKVFDRDRGGAEIVSSLIHLLDPSANHSLRDRYLHDIDIDFSRCTFVLTYNDASKINPILLNRLRRITFEEPTHAQRRQILSQQLLPRVQRRLGTTMTIDSRSVDHLLEETRGHTGVRDLERSVDHVLSCASLDRALAKRATRDEAGVLTPTEVTQYMGYCRPQDDGATSPPLGMYA